MPTRLEQDIIEACDLRIGAKIGAPLWQMPMTLMRAMWDLVGSRVVDALVKCSL